MQYRPIAKNVLALFLLSMLQIPALRAETCGDIGGTGIVANGCGVGGTGHGSIKQEIGGTGHSNTAKGIGGTGQIASKTGIGGTGHSKGDGGIGGTGIVGIVTGFGSVWVNGLEVQFDAKTPVEDNTEKVSTKDLALGQLVTIEADENKNEIKAEKISVVNAVAGSITAVDTTNNTLTILGQTVSVTPQTILDLQQGDKKVQQLAQGESVKISGLRMANGKIIASRIMHTSPQAETSLVGPVTKIGKSTVEIYGLQIETDKANQLKLGQEILVSGKLDGDKLVASTIAPSPASRMFETANQVSLQGYVGEHNSQTQIKVGNMDIVVPAQSEKLQTMENQLSAGELIVVRGHIDQDHRIIADRIEIDRSFSDRVQHNVVSGAEQRQETQEKVERSHSADRLEIDRLDANNYIDHPEHYDSPNHTSSNESHSSHDTVESSGHSN